MSGTDGIRQDGRGRRRRAAPRTPDPLLPLKLEAARELGLLEKAVRVGWGNLSAAEAGRIGGYMTRLRNEARGHPGASGFNEARGHPGASGFNEARGHPGASGFDEARGLPDASGFNEARGLPDASGFKEARRAE